MKDWNKLFTPEKLATLFPPERADAFFDALFGDASEGAYDIVLSFKKNHSDNFLEFAFVLNQRPEKCLVCSLTYGLPEVFLRHPVINLKKLISDLNDLMGEDLKFYNWEIGPTREISKICHEIPLKLFLQDS